MELFLDFKAGPKGSVNIRIEKPVAKITNKVQPVKLLPKPSMENELLMKIAGFVCKMKGITLAQLLAKK